MTVTDNLLIEMSRSIGQTGMTQHKNDLAVPCVTAQRLAVCTISSEVRVDTHNQ